MDKYLLRVRNSNHDPDEQGQISDGRNRRVRFTQPNETLPRHAGPPRGRRDSIPSNRDNFLRDWPHPDTVELPCMVEDDFCDPFPLYHPSIARYFDEDDRLLVNFGRRKVHATGGGGGGSGGGGGGDSVVGDDLDRDQSFVHHFHGHADHVTMGQDGRLIDKRYAYSCKGHVKDYYHLFRPIPADQDGGPKDLDLPDEINRQILHALADGTDHKTAPENGSAPVGESDGWDEDEHTPVYWAQRTREVDFFVRHDVWSVDPIGDWSYLNRHKVPKHFLRKLRRYLEIRPMEFLSDTGSYRMFHVLNQYKDLRGTVDRTSPGHVKFVEGLKNWTVGCCGRLSALDQARQMELDYLGMVWLSIWDPRLQANIFQLKEMSMSDWFFTRVGWSTAVGVGELLTKNEVHCLDDYWEHRPARHADEDDDEGDFEELEDWITGEDEEDEGQHQEKQETGAG